MDAPESSSELQVVLVSDVEPELAATKAAPEENEIEPPLEQEPLKPSFEKHLKPATAAKPQQVKQNLSPVVSSSVKAIERIVVNVPDVDALAAYEELLRKEKIRLAVKHQKVADIQIEVPEPKTSGPLPPAYIPPKSKRAEEKESAMISMHVMDGNQYLSKLHTAIMKNRRYSAATHYRQLEGDVTIEFRILQSGNIDHIKVVRSSGHKLLDAQAIKSVKATSPFMAFPEKMGRRPRIKKVVIKFRL